MTKPETLNALASFNVAAIGWMLLWKKRRIREAEDRAYQLAVELDFRDFLKAKGWCPENADAWDDDALRKEFLEKLHPDPESDAPAVCPPEGLLVPVFADENLGEKFEIAGPGTISLDVEVLTREVVLHRGFQLAEHLARAGRRVRNLLAFLRALARNSKKSRALWAKVEVDLDEIAL